MVINCRRSFSTTPGRRRFHPCSLKAATSSGLSAGIVGSHCFCSPSLVFSSPDPARFVERQADRIGPMIHEGCAKSQACRGFLSCLKEPCDRVGRVVLLPQQSL